MTGLVSVLPSPPQPALLNPPPLAPDTTMILDPNTSQMVRLVQFFTHRNTRTYYFAGFEYSEHASTTLVRCRHAGRLYVYSLLTTSCSDRFVASGPFVPESTSKADNVKVLPQPYTTPVGPAPRMPSMPSTTVYNYVNPITHEHIVSLLPPDHPQMICLQQGGHVPRVQFGILGEWIPRFK